MLGRVTPAPASQAAQAAQEEDADLLDSEVEEVVLNYHGASGQGHKATCQVQDLWHARVTSLREHGGQVSGVSYLEVFFSTSSTEVRSAHMVLPSR